MLSKLAFLAVSALCCAAAELHEAVERCDVPLVRQIIVEGAAISEMNGALDTPLHVAVRAGKPACVYLLLAAGANRYPPNRAGATPSLLARRYPAGEIQEEMSFLLERPDIVRDGLHLRGRAG